MKCLVVDVFLICPANDINFLSVKLFTLQLYFGYLIYNLIFDYLDILFRLIFVIYVNCYRSV